MTDKKPLRNPKDYINVSVLRSNQELVKQYLEKEGIGADVGKFYDKAAMEKLNKLKSNK